MELGRKFDPRKRELKVERKFDLKLNQELKRKSELEQERKLKDDARFKELHTLQISHELLSEQDSLTLQISPDHLERNNLPGSNSRWVSVDTILSTPDGRSKKKEIGIKDEIIKFRCTTYEKKLLTLKAKSTGLTISEYFRRVAFEQKIVERLSDSEIEIYQTLVKYHNNFKAISNLIKKKHPNLTQEVLKLAKEIKEHLKKFDP